MNRSSYFNYIEEKLNFIVFRIKERGKLNILDLNIYAENFFKMVEKMNFSEIKCCLKQKNPLDKDD